MSKKALIIPKDESKIDTVLKYLEDGALIIIPTDNVYGFMGNGNIPEVIDRIYKLKDRDRSKPLCYYTTPKDAPIWGQIDSNSEEIISLWPAPISIIVPKHKCVPDYVTSGMDSVLLVCIDQYTKELAQRASFPIVATSANLAGEPPITDFDAAYQQFDGFVDVILKGEPSKRAMSSTIVNMTFCPPVVQRVGPYGIEDVRKIVPEAVLP